MVPFIGITLDHEPGGGYSAVPWYAVRQNYADAIADAGGVPIALPHHPELAEAMLARIDGLVVTGGAFDVDPAMFGASERHPRVKLKARRTEFEAAVLRLALERDLPVLAICGGEQLLNVLLGGTLIQHIPDEVPNALEHEQKQPRHLPAHDVRVTPESRLAEILGTYELAVNSTHHQAVGQPGNGVTVSARSGDGVVEAIEVVEKRFCIGTQWHPEYDSGGERARVFEAFVRAARERGATSVEEVR